MKFDYEYTEIEGYDSQYKNEDFEFGVPVEAIYVKSKVSTDRGIPSLKPCRFLVPKEMLSVHMKKDCQIMIWMRQKPCLRQKNYCSWKN